MKIRTTMTAGGAGRLLLVIITAIALAGSVAGGERTIRYYKSTMMPGEVSQTPVKDSMGMDMVPVYEGEDAQGAIRIDPVTQQNMGLRTAIVTTGPLRRAIRTVGNFEYNETGLTDVTTRADGWIEKLYADTTGKQVHAGEPLFEFFSPDLLTAQAEFLNALTFNSTAGLDRAAIRRGAVQKLRLLGITDDQITSLESSRQARRTLRMDAPRDGVIVEKSAVQGMRAASGEKLFRIADLSTIWLIAQFYEQDLPYVQPGQEAEASLSYYPDRKFRGRITYIYPALDEKTRTGRVRIEFHNPGFFLKPGMFANVLVRAELKPSAVLVPDIAILRSGERSSVFIALDGGRFESREVHLGLNAEGGYSEVLHGLNPGERVVTSAQFLLDSESRLQEAIQKMLRPPGQTSAPVEHASHAPGMQPIVSQADPDSPLSATHGTVAYVCPMPEHASILYSGPGRCPICRMTLVPVTGAQLPQLRKMPAVLYYTCPMPEHSDVRSSTSGKCPRCGMTLIPVTEDSTTSGSTEANNHAGHATEPTSTTVSTTDSVTTEPSMSPNPPTHTEHSGHVM